MNNEGTKERLRKELLKIAGNPGDTARQAMEAHWEMLCLIAADYGQTLPMDNWKDAEQEWARVGPAARAVVEAIATLEETLEGLGRVACMPIPHLLLDLLQLGYQDRDLGRILTERSLMKMGKIRVVKEPIDLLFRDMEGFANQAETYCREAKGIANGVQKESEFEKKTILLSQIIFLLKCPKTHAQWMAAAIDSWERNRRDDAPLEPRRFERAVRRLDNQTIWRLSFRIRQFNRIFNNSKNLTNPSLENQDVPTRTPP